MFLQVPQHRGLQHINRYPRGNENVPYNLPFIELFLQHNPGQKHYENIGKSVDYGTVFHVRSRVCVGVHQQHREEYEIGQNYPPVKILVYEAFVFNICAFFQQHLR